MHPEPSLMMPWAIKVCSKKDFHLNVCATGQFHVVSLHFWLWAIFLIAVFLLYCWFLGHVPIWNQFLLSLAESFPDPIFGVTDKQGHLSWEECPQNPESSQRPHHFRPHSLGRSISRSNVMWLGMNVWLPAWVLHHQVLPQFPQFRLSEG